MASCTMQFHSLSLQKASSMNVILPDRHESQGPFPVFYLLHGLSDDHTIWSRRTSIERYVEGLPLIVVMPDGGRGFFCDASQGAPHESHIVRDVIGFTDRFFNTIPSRQGRAIGGLSMGGYGAVKLALKFPDLFCSATSHSGVLALASRRDLPDELKLILGPSYTGGRDDVFALAESVPREAVPAIRFDCGIDDELLEDNRSFHGHLQTLGIPHEYEEFPGGHSWPYWDTHVQEAVAFHRRSLRI